MAVPDRRSRRCPASRARRGISLIWLIMVLLTVIGLIGLACDTGYAMLVTHQLQNAADAAALAAAQQIQTNPDEVRATAARVGAENSAANAPVILNLNEGNNPGGDIVVGRYSRDTGVFDPASDSPNAIRVDAKRTAASSNGALALNFAGAFGVPAIDVSRSAIAMNHGGTGAGMISLCSTCPCALTISGSPVIIVDGGPIQINSTNSCAVCARGNGEIIAPSMNIGGGYCVQGGAFQFEGTVNSGVPPIDDPLAHLPELTWDENFDLGSIDTSDVYPPGYYGGGVDLIGGDVLLEPGLYVLGGAGLHIGGNARFTADGVMLFIKPGTGNVDINGSGEIVITPPDPERHNYGGASTFEGISIFQSRSNTNESTIIGTGRLELEGTLYFPRANIRIGGTGDGLGNQLIAHTIEIFGNGEVTINYDGRFSAPGNKSFLVQ